jgi:hypothetical protein
VIGKTLKGNKPRKVADETISIVSGFVGRILREDPKAGQRKTMADICGVTLVKL